MPFSDEDILEDIVEAGRRRQDVEEAEILTARGYRVSFRPYVFTEAKARAKRTPEQWAKWEAYQAKHNPPKAKPTPCRRRWLFANREKVTALKRKWRHRNAERCRRDARTRYWSNPEPKREKARLRERAKTARRRLERLVLLALILHAAPTLEHA